MFICRTCHEENHGPFDTHLSGSYGACEVCGYTAACADCQCPVLHPRAPEPAEPPPIPKGDL